MRADILRIIESLGESINITLRYPFYKLILGELGRDVTFYGRVRFIRPYNVTIGDGCWINERVVFLAREQIVLGKAVNVARETIFLTATNTVDDGKASGHIGKPVQIGDNVWIGARSIILPGVSIGENSIIGAGTVVPKDIPANVVAVGNPAKVIKNLS